MSNVSKNRGSVGPSTTIVVQSAVVPSFSMGFKDYKFEYESIQKLPLYEYSKELAILESQLESVKTVKISNIDTEILNVDMKAEQSFIESYIDIPSTIKTVLFFTFIGAMLSLLLTRFLNGRLDS